MRALRMPKETKNPFVRVLALLGLLAIVTFSTAITVRDIKREVLPKVGLLLNHSNVTQTGGE